MARFKWILLLLIMGIAAKGLAQEYRANVSLSYGVPVFGTFFQDGFESLLGARLVGGHYRTENFMIGGSFETIQFRPYRDNPISINKANYYALTFRIGYNILGGTANRLEPTAETGYYFFRYNDGGFTGQSFGIGLGGEYVYYIEKNYGLSLGLKWTNVFDRFGRNKNPNDVSNAQMFILSLGLLFDF